MRIMVFDVPAESGGALSVLKDFYNEYKADQNNEYVFVVSKPKLEEAKNIKVLRYPWIKKSWLHRLYFDNFIAHKIIKKYKIDRVLSLQNIMIPHTKIYQSVFVHNALPFSEYKFKFFENRLLWIYQNILSRSIFKSIKKTDYIIVQTNWMKEKCIDQLNIKSDKVEVKPAKLDIEIKKAFQRNKNNLSTFFYPASGMFFKNHKAIIDACIKLNKQGVKDYNVILTLNGDENTHIVELYKKVIENKLPIQFIGSITREEVYEFYSKSILIFPSFIETVGLPLLEAKLHSSPIFVSDCAYAHEILINYKNVKFFNPFNSDELARLIEDCLEIY